MHAGKKLDDIAMRRFNLKPANLKTGAVLGCGELYDCIEFNDRTWELWRSNHLNEGELKKKQFAWFLRNVNRIAPIACKGKLGLMKID